MSTLRNVNIFGLGCLILFIATFVNAGNLTENFTTNNYPWTNSVTLALFLSIPIISITSGYISSTKYILEPTSLAISIGLAFGILFGTFTNELMINHLFTLVVLGAFVGFITSGSESPVLSPILFLLKIALTVTAGITTTAAIQHAGFANVITLIMIYATSAILGFSLLFLRRHKDSLSLGNKLSNW